VTVVILGLLPAVAGAQPVTAAAVIQPTTRLEIPPPKLRTWKEMEAAAALEAAGPPPSPREIPFRPTMDAALYRQLKAQAVPNKATQAPVAPGITSLAPLASTTLTNPISFEGIDSVTAGNLRPPDTHGAAGLNHFVEITNSHIDIYEKTGNHVSGVPLSTFFIYSTKSLFDPRVIYDSVARRWIMSADAFAESATTQWFFFAVSKTDDPRGDYFIYKVNVSSGNGPIPTPANPNVLEWDFPQVGLDRDAVIFTANFFPGAGGFEARMFTVAKSLLYTNNGPNPVTLTPHLFIGLEGTLAPPIVLDTNPNTYLVAADSTINTNTMTIYTLTNSGAILPDLPVLSGPATISNVPTYSFPLNAPQPGTPALLDTSDARFINAGTQIGDSLFQVHSISVSPTTHDRAICRFYEFDGKNKTVIQHGDFFKSSTSSDFNASIAANRHKDVFVTWSATDTNVNAEVRFSGRLHTDPLNVIPSPGSLLTGGTSADFYFVGAPVGNQRWGDYSAVSLDPADPSGGTAWIVNEKILTTTTWGSHIGSIHLPVKTPLPYVDLLLLGD
jgi:hypothetical protein